jgi:hypothetical protein
LVRYHATKASVKGLQKRTELGIAQALLGMPLTEKEMLGSISLRSPSSQDRRLSAMALIASRSSLGWEVNWPENLAQISKAAPAAQWPFLIGRGRPLPSLFDLESWTVVGMGITRS